MIMKKKLFLVAMIFICTLAICGSAVAVDSQNVTADSANIQSLKDSSYNSTNTTVTQPSVNHQPAPTNQPPTPTAQQTAAYEGVADPVNIQGYWINNGPGEIKNINITALKKAGITDIFVITNKQNPAGTLQPFIDAFAGSGIRVHAWITCFKDQNGTWYDPEQNPALVDQLVNNIISIATNYNVDGIHLDYVRYPGTAYQHTNATETVTSFVQRVYNAIQNINSQQIPGKHQILVSAALMPETDKNAYYYGQDYGQLAPYLDFLVPMIYKGNYNQNTTWIGATTQYIVQHAGGKPVVAGLQTYRSDSNPIPISASELNADIITARNNGSSGYVLFKYGLVDSTIPGIPNYQTATVAQITTAAASLKNYIETNQRLPSTVTVGTLQLNMSAFLHLLLNSLINIKRGNTNPVSLIDFREPLSPSESLTSGNIAKSEYLSIASSVQSYMDVNGMGPNYATSSLGKIRYETLIYMYSRILNYYGVNKVLPNYVSAKPWFNPPRVISSNPVSNATGVSTTSAITITFDKNVLAGPNFAGIYVKNLASGNLVSIASKTITNNILTIKQTNSRIANTTYQVYVPIGAVQDSTGSYLATAYTFNFTTANGNTTPPTVSANPAGGTYTTTQTVTLATTDPDSTATTYYTTDGSDPKSSTSRIVYSTPIQIATTTLLRYIAVDPDGNWSPNYSQTYTINQSINTVTISQLSVAAATVKNYYENHQKTLPNSVTINGNTISMSQMLYLLTTGTLNINNGNLNPITLKAVNSSPNPSGSITSGNIQKPEYITLAQNILTFINTNGRTPNYKPTTLGNMPFKYLVYMYSKIVSYYGSNSRLPSYVSMAP